MSKLVSTSDGLHQILKENEDSIKEDFITIKLFVDSAIRQKLRERGIKVGDDEIIAHLQRLEAAKSRHINQRAIIRKRRNHQRRVERQKAKLEEKLGE